MVGSLGADVCVVADDLDVAPDGGDSVGVQAADILEATVGENLDEGSTVGLAQQGKLAAGRGGPSC